MMKKIGVLIIFCFSLFCFSNDVSAAGNLGVSASSTTVTVGSTVKIYVKADKLAGKISVSSSNGGILSGGTGGEWIENQTKTYTFKANTVGTATITVTPLTLGDFETGGSYTASKKITINVVKPRDKSTNNNLKGLSIEGYSLSPEFNKNTLEYKVELPANVEKIKINATKEDGYASVSGDGEVTVNEGENKLEIKVTSETGSTKVYTIIATVKDENPIIASIDNKKNTVIKRAGLISKPDHFEETTVKINDFDIPAFYNERNKITLIGLRDEQANIFLAIYDEKNKTYQRYLPLNGNPISFFKVEDKKELKGYSKKEITIDNTVYSGYSLQKNSEFVLLYGKNLITGEEGWYSYHTKEKTLQKYDDAAIKNLQKELEELKEKDKILILGLGGLSILLALTLLVMIFRKDRKKTKKLILADIVPEGKEEPIAKQIIDEKVIEIDERPVDTEEEIPKKKKKKNKYDIDL